MCFDFFFYWILKSKVCLCGFFRSNGGLNDRLLDLVDCWDKEVIFGEGGVGNFGFVFESSR